MFFTTDPVDASVPITNATEQLGLLTTAFEKYVATGPLGMVKVAHDLQKQMIVLDNSSKNLLAYSSHTVCLVPLYSISLMRFIWPVASIAGPKMLCTKRCVPTLFSLLVMYKLAHGGVHSIQAGIKN